jgi:hypothetical protein
MATYAELNQILTDTVAGAQVLREKVGVACLIAVNAIVSNADTGAPFSQAAGAHTARLKWAELLLSSYHPTVKELFGIVIAANAGATQAQILAATDASIQSSVNSSIDALASNLS